MSEYSINHAEQILEIERRRIETESQLHHILQLDCFKSYLEAFAPFGWSESIDISKSPDFTPMLQGFEVDFWRCLMEALILMKVYPFEKFLKNGYPETKWIETELKGKQKRHISLQHFQSYMGLSRRVESSGDGITIKWGNSSLMRSHFYIWVMARICPKPPRRLDTLVGAKLGDKWDFMRSKGKAKGKDAIIRVCFYATRLLFQRLRDHTVF